MTNSIRAIMKKAGQPATICGIENNLATLKVIVGGNISTVWIASDGEALIGIVLNSADIGLPVNIILENGAPIHGDIVLVRANGKTGERLTFDDDSEIEQWRAALDALEPWPENKLATELPDIQIPSSENILSAIVVPRMLDTDTDDELSAEEIIRRLSIKLNRGCEIVTIADAPELYAEAITVMHGQGMQFEVIDELTSLLQFPNEQRYLRLVKWLAENPIENVADLAALFKIKTGQSDWPIKLVEAIETRTPGFVCSLRAPGDDQGIEFSDEKSAPYQIDYPFRATELFSLIEQVNTKTNARPD